MIGRLLIDETRRRLALLDELIEQNELSADAERWHLKRVTRRLVQGCEDRELLRGFTEGLLEASVGDIERENGKRWEKYIRSENERIYKLGLARVSKNFEADRVPGMQVRQEPSKPDFSGFLLGGGPFEEGGRHVVFEAKSCLNETSFGFGQLTDHQWSHLDDAHHAGAISFVYVLESHGEVDDDGEWVPDRPPRKWLFPWSVVLEWDEERSSIPFVDDSPFEKKAGEHWLKCWRRLHRGGAV